MKVVNVPYVSLEDVQYFEDLLLGGCYYKFSDFFTDSKNVFAHDFINLICKIVVEKWSIAKMKLIVFDDFQTTAREKVTAEFIDHVFVNGQTLNVFDTKTHFSLGVNFDDIKNVTIDGMITKKRFPKFKFDFFVGSTRMRLILVIPYIMEDLDYEDLIDDEDLIEL